MSPERSATTRDPSVPLWIVVPTLALGCAYASVLFARYGLYDDYLNSERSAGELLRVSVAGGRPAGGVLSAAGFMATPHIDGFGTLRALAVGLLVVQAVLLALILSKRLDGVWWGSCISAAAHLTVGPQIIVGWGATMWPVILSSVAAGWAGWVFASPAGTERRIVGIVALVGSLAIYQPTGMAAVGMVGLMFVISSETGSRALRSLASAAVWLILSFVGYAAVLVASTRLVTSGGSRTALVEDLGAKASWIVRTVVPRLLHPFDVSASPDVGFYSVVVVGLVLVAGWQPGTDLLTRLMRTTVAVALPFVCYLPNIVVAESWASARSLFVVDIVVVTLAGVGLHTLTGHVARVKRAPATLAAGAMLAALGMFVAAAGRNVTTLIAEPNGAELRAVQASMDAVLSAEPVAVEIVPSEWQDTIAPRISFDEFGYPASSAYWAIIPMVSPVIEARGFDGPVVVALDGVDIPEGATRLDLGGVLSAVDPP